MPRKKMTPEQIAARTEKARATRERKKQEALSKLGLSEKQRTKRVRRKRNMTEEQKQAARERLAAARAKKRPSQNLMIHEDVRNLPDEHPLSYKTVRGWQQENKQLLASIKAFKESKDAKERLKYIQTECYITNIGTYLRTGVWVDEFYGSQQQHKIKKRCVAMAYDKHGIAKRSVGVWYPDIGTEWTEEMELNARN